MAAPDKIPPSEDGPQSDGQAFYGDLHDLFRRYLDEWPSLTIFETLGALEAFKADLLDNLAKSRSVGGDEDEGERWKTRGGG